MSQTEKPTTIQGDAGQVVSADQFENKSNSQVNHNNVSVTVGGAQALSGEKLTYKQRRVIRELVDELAQVSGDAPQTLWGRVHAHAGVDRVADIPKELFQQIKGEVEQALSKALRAKEPAAPSVVQPEERSPTKVRVECRQCESAHRNADKLRFTAQTALAVALVACIAAAILGLRFTQAPELPAEYFHSCTFDGKTYSVGSVMPALKAVCAADEKGDAPSWRAATAAKGK